MLPFMPPNLRADLPIYPVHMQLLRITAMTVPGPAGVAQTAGSSVTGPVLYVSFTQQMREGPLLPRDREPCLADDVNSTGLLPGFHHGRLTGSFNGLPVYSVVALGPTGSLIGVQGPPGATGSAGPPGTMGTPGPVGSVGQPGTMGTPGPAGSAGQPGSQGTKGDPGPAGSDGQPGTMGTAGSPGPQGIQGVQGPPGATGATGSPGATGPAGSCGPCGSGAPFVEPVLINSYIITPPRTVTIGTNQNNYTIDDTTSTLLVTATSDFTFSGFNLGTNSGRIVTVVNSPSSTGRITVANNSGSSSAGNRVITSTGANRVMSPGEAMQLTYSSAVGNIVESGTTVSTTALSSSPVWTKYTKTFTDFSIAGTSNSITLVTLPARSFIDAFVMKHSVSFLGGAIGAYSMDLGVTGNTTLWHTAFNVFQAPGDTVLVVPSGFLADPYRHVAINVLATAQSGGANLNAATQGSIDIWLRVSQLP